MYVGIKTADVLSEMLHTLTMLSVLSRWEMDDGAELEDGEKAMVEELQRAFFVCHCNPGLQDPPEVDETVAEQTQGGTQTPDKSAAQ